MGKETISTFKMADIDFYSNIVFNIDSNLNERIAMDDKKKIAELGGVSVLARRLKVTPQRVQNWTRRGIPAKVKLDNYELFHNSNKSK